MLSNLHFSDMAKPNRYYEEGMNVPILLWLDNIDEEALKQAVNVASLPFIFHHVSLMPDSHVGYGVPIGCVMATKNYIVPNAVGVDVGCGMCVIRTNLTEIERDTLIAIMNDIKNCIPVGKNWHNHSDYKDYLPEVDSVSNIKDSVVIKNLEKASRYIGTLGGGNHFIEIQRGNDGFIYIMLHSGSRNLGKQVCDHYNNLAKEINKKYFSKVPADWGLAFLPFDSDEGRNYFKEMRYCVDFALANRKVMMDLIKDIFKTYIDSVEFDNFININHNYASIENHYGENVFIHRKGATKATEKTIGIIPGSQGSYSYIVKGKGNAESFMSSSHGAGRVLSRNKARSELNLEEEQRKLDEKGIIHSLKNVNDLDEASSAYKDISIVMENQKNLVDIVVELSPLAVIKG